jgi:hypothetical protein
MVATKISLGVQHGSHDALFIETAVTTRIDFHQHPTKKPWRDAPNLLKTLTDTTDERTYTRCNSTAVIPNGNDRKTKIKHAVDKYVTKLAKIRKLQKEDLRDLES